MQYYEKLLQLWIAVVDQSYFDGVEDALNAVMRINHERWASSRCILYAYLKVILVNH